MNGFDCTKPKADRFPDRHLFAKSKRLFDFNVEEKNATGFTSPSIALMVR
jgi:hypothetical protein